MRKIRWLALPIVVLLLLGCGLTNGIQQIQQAATNMPGILTSAPTAMGAVETAAAGQSSNNCPSTPTAGGLGVGLDNAKAVLQLTQQFTFTDSSVDGQPASTAALSSAAAATFSAISNGFSAQFIGDPCNLSEISVTIPRTDQQATVDQGIGVTNILFAGVLPPDVQFGFLSWLTQNYANVAVGAQQQTTIGSMQFTLQRNQTSMLLDILPAK